MFILKHTREIEADKLHFTNKCFSHDIKSISLSTAWKWVTVTARFEGPPLTAIEKPWRWDHSDGRVVVLLDLGPWRSSRQV